MRRDDVATIVDDRAGFYMVPSVAIAKARARLSGAHLAEALAGLACLARESFAQRGASREEAQVCEATLEVLSGRVFGVSRARAIRIVENLADAGALMKEADRLDGVRRLPTRITFVDLAVPFAYVSGPAFRALMAASGDGRPPLGALALYLTLVALGGEQRDEFPDGKRRVARASQVELAKLSGLSVTSVKRTIAVLKAAELVIERPQPDHVLKTKAVFWLIDPGERGERVQDAGEARHSRPRPEALSRAMVGAAARPVAHAESGRPVTAEPTDRPQPNRGRVPAQPSTGHSGTDGQATAEPWSGRWETVDGPQENSVMGRGRTDGQLSDPSRARGDVEQMTTDEQISQTVRADACLGSRQGGEGDELEQLVDTFRRWVADALGERRAHALYDADMWRGAARRLLEHYDLDRILAGIERLGRDPLLADKATTLPAFEQVADRAITRAAADRRLAAHRDATTPSAARSSALPSWAAAQELLRQAVSAFGGGGEERALAFLEDREPHVAAFARDVGWRTIVRSDAQMTDVKFAYLQYRPADEREAAA